ncbi:MAG: hypothetical protein ACXWV0_05345 [Flavisolibacter sp.]
MSYRSRVYRQRNTQQNDHDQSKDQDKFFSRSSEKSNGTRNAFFQAKPNDAAAGAEDALEKDANQSATQVANQDPAKDKKEETVQRLATPEEDKQTSTNDERQKNDKDKQS